MLTFGQAQAGTRSVKFHQKGQSFVGIVSDEPSQKQQTVFGGNGELAWWDDAKTQPKMQWTFPVQVVKEDVCDCDEFCQGGAKNADYGSDDDDGRRVLYVPASGNLVRAIASAIKQAGAPGGEPEVGGTLAIQRTGVDHSKAKSGKPPVTYSATYQRPTPESLAKVKKAAPKPSLQDDGGDRKLTLNDMMGFSTSS